MPRPTPHSRAEYKHSREVTTRWMDNDAYGHVNNAVYYAFFDTVVNAWLIEHGALDVENGEVIGLVVETGCHYFASLSYPETVTAAIRVAHIGKSSVRYEVALFSARSQAAAAQGHFIHVYVDRATRRPVQELPAPLLSALEPLVVEKGKPVATPAP
jgi:acyl-CoA thioester hydrolase